VAGGATRRLTGRRFARDIILRVIGSRISHYRILARLGEGGMGVVWRAFDEHLEREVAIKVLPPGALADDEARRRLLREARLASQLNHPNICTIHEVGDADGVAYIAMELVDGGTLDRRIDPGGLPAETVIRHGAQVADALAHAHEQGILHRDLKAANVMVTPEGRIKVLDFGIATRIDPPGAEAATRHTAAGTRAGADAGTPHTMAPERLRGEPADARSDLWALGVLLHEMAGGARPFRGTTPIELGAAILHAPPEPLPARVPPGLAAVIDRCLAKDPARRYRQAGEVRAALEALAPGHAAAPATPSAREAAPGGRGRPARLALLAAAAVALVAALLALDAGGLRSRLAPGGGGGGGGRIRSLAVLPLDNFSRDPEQQYFADGMTDELITALAQIGTLRVISRTSVMGLRNTTLSMPEIGRKLGVDAIVEGSVQRSGDRVRVTAQLVRAASDEHVWARSYDRELSDALALQGEVAAAIAREVKAQLTPAERAQIGDVRPVSPKSYELYLRGLEAYRRWDPRSERAALEFLTQALREDSTFASAWAVLGLVALQHPGPASRDEETALARRAAERAIALEPDLGLGHALLGQIEHMAWNWAAAERAYRRAVALSPNSFEVHHNYSHLLLDLGRLEESGDESRTALALDPLNTAAITHLGWQLLVEERHDEAMARYREALAIDPTYAEAYWHMTYVHLLTGRAADAEATWRRLVEIEAPTDTLWMRAMIEAKSGRAARASRVLATMLAEHEQGRQSAHGLALVFAQLGRRDEAFAWLDRSVAARESELVNLRLNPFSGPLWDDPRFADVLRRMGQPVRS
jgi:TolB-like protein/Tfp pilus assembly protein PilF